MLTKTCSIAKWFINSWLYENYVATGKRWQTNVNLRKMLCQSKVFLHLGTENIKKKKKKKKKIKHPFWSYRHLQHFHITVCFLCLSLHWLRDNNHSYGRLDNPLLSQCFELFALNRYLKWQSFRLSPGGAASHSPDLKAPTVILVVVF